MKHSPSIVFLFTLVLLLGCSPIPTDGDINPREPRKNDGIPTIPMQEYTSFWSHESRIDLRFEMTPTNLQHMSDSGAVKNDIRNDIYFPMTLHLTLNEETYLLNEVGIRIKGNVFSRSPIAEDGVLHSPSGLKLSFNETFTEPYYETYGLKKLWTEQDPAYQRRKDRTLFGMDKLDLKWNRSNDPSMINQAFSFHLFDAWTPISTQSTLGTVAFTLGDTTTNVGIFMLNEAINKTFIRRHFNKAEAQGDLYKALWPVDLNMVDPLGRQVLNRVGNTYRVNPDVIGVENTFINYHPTYDLKTNKTTSNHTHLIRLIRTLATAGALPLNERKASIESVVHIPSFLQYAAASYLMGNPDDMRANVNNTYIYFHPTTGQAYFIPYDYDWTLGLTWSEDLNVQMRTISPLYNISPVHGQTINNPLLWYTLLEENDDRSMSETYPMIPAFQTIYLNHINTWRASSTFTILSYQQMFRTYRNTYKDYETDIESYSSFIHIDRFITHQVGINQTLDSFF
jgi:hypothetical protein